MLIARRTGAVAFVGILVAGCALVPLAEGPSTSPFVDPTPTGTASASPEPTGAASIAAPKTAEPTQSPALIDFSSAAWFQWLYSPDSETASLYVGRLDGRTFKVIDSGRPVGARGPMAGPVHGMLLTSWVDSNERRSIDLVDTADGSRTTIAADNSVTLAAIDPSGTYAYWTTIDDGKISGLWRRAVSGGPAEKVLAGRDVPGPEINFSLDGKYIAISKWRGQPGAMEANYDHAVFDADFHLIGRLQDSPSYGPVVGFLGDRLVVYPHLSDDMPSTFPLFALDIHDWSAQEIVSTADGSAAIVPDTDGTPRLIFDGHDNQNRYTLRVLDADGSPRVLFVGDAPWDDPLQAMVFPSTGRNVAAPGWVAVFPQGGAMTTVAPTSDHADRWLVP